jgi:hypothetical protein
MALAHSAGTDFMADPARPIHGVHPGVILIGMIGVFVYLVGVAFFMTGNLADNLDLYGVAGFAVIFFTLTLGLAARAARDRRWRGEDDETLTEFAEDNVSIATGTISGREALIQVLVLPATLAVGMIAIGLVFANGW